MIFALDIFHLNDAQSAPYIAFVQDVSADDLTSIFKFLAHTSTTELVDKPLNSVFIFARCDQLT